VLAPRRAPPLAAPTIVSGRTVSLADFAGKPVVLAFWRSICTADACQDTTLFELQQLAQIRSDLAVIGVTARQQLSDEERRHLPLGYPHVRDISGEIAAAYAVTRFPTLVFLDHEHRLRAKIVGVPTEAELMRAVRRATANARAAKCAACSLP
jgi:peroxiredoxin